MISGCFNYGYVHPEKVITEFVSGGIYGEGGKNYTSGTSTVNTKNSLAIKDCYNYGKIEAHGFAGGIVGRTATVAPETNYKYSISYCGNEGEVTVTDAGRSTCGAGGIAGYLYGTAGNEITRCYNVGSVTAIGNNATGNVRSSGIISYFNGQKIMLQHSYNAGTVSANGANATAYQLFYNNNENGSDSTYIKNNHALYVKGAVYEKNGTQASSVTTFTEAELKDGTLRDRINGTAWEFIYWQNVEMENHPMLRTDEGLTL